MKNAERVIKFKNIIGYGITDLFGMGSLAVVGAWMLYFYTTFCGLSPVEAGAIFAVARIIDALISPLMGYITDNFGSTRLGKKFGRRRFFILLGIPFVACYSLLFVAGMSFWYYLFSYIILEITLALVMVPYETLAAEMTKDFSTRSKLAGSRMLFSQSAVFIASILPGRLMQIFGENTAISFFYTAAVFSVIFVIALITVYFSTWETEEEKVDVSFKVEKLSLLENVKKVLAELSSTFRIKTFRHHLAIYIFSFTSMDIFIAVFTYYIVFALHQTSVLSSNLLTIMSVSQVAAVAGTIWLVVKIGPASCVKIASLLSIVSIIGYVSVYGLAPENIFPYLMAICIVMGLSRGAATFIPWNVYSFIPDVDEMVTTRRREGIFAGVMTFSRKTTVAVAIFIVGNILQMGGFVAGAKEQSLTTVNTVLGLMIVGVIGLQLMTLVYAFRFKLSKQRHDIILDEINRLKAGGSMEHAGDSTRKTVEELTGWKYEETWGNNNVGYKVNAQSAKSVSETL
ncbi:MFS transporter [Pelosinus sp. UFO1]|uniref:MFS transporter n=1 Tax=Pelosinus sp. UFO1 TaxID=484770 RepID=UPI0004D15A2C|nr:MFS transporter [Pelosinus sp. UFO1]AIF53413.1 hypothetical protein UFO1_3870 [Pelosinus sp. UFO1]